MSETVTEYKHEEKENKIDTIKSVYQTDNLVEMIHSFLSKESSQNQIKRYEAGRVGKFYPSSVGDCKRKIAYQMIGYPGSPIKGQSLLVMDNGTYFHNRMEDIFERMGIMIAPELSLKDEELRISGRSDAIVWNFLKEDSEPPGEEIELYKQGDAGGRELVYKGPSNDVLIVEFKSIKSKGYHDYLPKTKPKKEHEMQLQLYFYLTGIRKGIVFYENKDTQEQKYFIVSYDESIVNSVLSDVKEVIEAIDKGVLPEREYQPVDIKCRYCDFRDICHPDFNAVDFNSII